MDYSDVCLKLSTMQDQSKDMPLSTRVGFPGPEQSSCVSIAISTMRLRRQSGHFGLPLPTWIDPEVVQKMVWFSPDRGGGKALNTCRPNRAKYKLTLVEKGQYAPFWSQCVKAVFKLKCLKVSFTEKPSNTCSFWNMIRQSELQMCAPHEHCPKHTLPRRKYEQVRRSESLLRDGENYYSWFYPPWLALAAVRLYWILQPGKSRASGN